MNLKDSRKSDLVIIGKCILTGKNDNPEPGSLAVKGNRILAVGTESDIENFVGPGTKMLRFGEELIIPGFHDFHIHLMLGALSQEIVCLRDARSQEDCAEMVSRFASDHLEQKWILGFGWYHVFWEKKELPHRSALDQLIPNRPVFLFNAEYHGAWVNSKALELLGIDRCTPDPPFGEIVRDENGEPTGILYETAIELAKVALDLDWEHRKRLLHSFLAKAARFGVTSVNDMFPLPGFEIDNLDIYRYFEEKNKLTTRIHFLAGLSGDLKRARSLRKIYKSDKLRFSGLKQFLDGVPTTYTACMVEPYADRADCSGLTLLPPEIIKDWVVRADQEGFRIRLHACGDGGVRLGLDCYEAARKANGSWDARHTIEHIELIHPLDIDRFAKLGVVASVQPEHLAITEKFAENPYLQKIGKEREPFAWAFKTLKNRGARLAFGSDYPIVDLDPLVGIYRSLTRLFNDSKPDGGWNPQERLTLSEALQAYTLGPAYGTFRENELGTLDAGKLADIVVLDRNIFAKTPEEICKAKVKITIMDGKIIFED